MTSLTNLIASRDTWLDRFQTQFLFANFYVRMLIPIWFLMAAVFVVLNSMIGRDVDWGGFVFFETIVVSFLFAMSFHRRMLKKWRNRSVLLEDETYTMISRSKKLLAEHGKVMLWDDVKKLATQIECRHRDEDLKIGALCCAIVKEGGWESLPDEAFAYMVNFPQSFKPFAYYY